ncbi:MAG: tRNA (adenosine(37)-N6)-dimethylallyltransferase MiaA [Maricaulis sp.]|uniref:tRNA (adenosine(37)-N6)-dimethylallyltransferase MiaA n=1 Tax=Maricaulis sp. TaxID=1486257 RepID=UPI00262E3418|nr:tRNA (adenosine(37)-N6)-dimethylallyltransferase MiaA [Maricaulis sp.]MDM7985195.1 tRNA (adenosine(37)-N6)-dimethylallyltransferase MiaA [Maricaulis sp.]
MTSALLIAGPTAAGKTALAIEAARRLDGEIINADSMQIYEGLPIITACPDEDERAAAPHHLFGTVDPGLRWSVGEWSQSALARFDDIVSRGKTPILVGGTGLYFNALTIGLAPVPEISPGTRAKAARLLEEGGLDAVRAEAERQDPVSAAKVKPADRQRLLRLVEVGWETGRALSSYHADTTPVLGERAWRGIVIEPNRQALYDRIDLRFDLMLDRGALEEVAAFKDRGLAPDLPAMKALGVPQLIAHLAGELELTAAIEIAKRESRRYAKRQMTWFRNQQASWDRVTALHKDDARKQLAALLG